MLKYLYIKDFIIFDEISIDLNEGFSGFTGETGAGKSIMVDAISLLCGQRGNGSLVANNKEMAVIEGIFDFSNNNKVIEFLNSIGFDSSDDIVVTREIKSDGKSNSKINHRMVNLSILKDLMDLAIDIHSQHDTQYLLKPNYHINLLDSYINNQKLIEDVSSSFLKYKALKDEMEQAISDKYNVEDIEFFKFEIDEIDNAKLQIGEDDELKEKEKLYYSLGKNLEKINTAIGMFEGGIQDDLFELTKLTKDINDKKITEANVTLTSSYYDISDAFDKIKEFVENLEISEEDINTIQERLFEINRIKRKYGVSIEAVLNYKEELLNKLSIINNRQEYLEKMQIKIDESFNDFNKLANKLTDLRKEKSSELDKLIMSNLKDLMLPNAKFKTEIITTNPNALGNDKVEFLISMNPGESLKPLSKVASGGELSRLMLGLKVIFSSLQGISTIIFDEIDTGVSGPVATSIGVKMKKLSKNTQVFSITHLAQVASIADNHYHVSKTSSDNKTITSIKHLSDDERIYELAILASGEATKLSIEAASELFRNNQGL